MRGCEEWPRIQGISALLSGSVKAVKLCFNRGFQEGEEAAGLETGLCRSPSFPKPSMLGPPLSPCDSGSFCPASPQARSINEGRMGCRGDVCALVGTGALRAWCQREQQLLCRGPGKLSFSFAVPGESQQAPPEVLSLIHLHFIPPGLPAEMNSPGYHRGLTLAACSASPASRG